MISGYDSERMEIVLFPFFEICQYGQEFSPNISYGPYIIFTLLHFFILNLMYENFRAVFHLSKLLSPLPPLFTVKKRFFSSSLWPITFE